MYYIKEMGSQSQSIEEYNYCKVQIIESISQIQDFIDNDIWNVADQALKRVISTNFH